MVIRRLGRFLTVYFIDNNRFFQGDPMSKSALDNSSYMARCGSSGDVYMNFPSLTDSEPDELKRFRKHHIEDLTSHSSTHRETE